MKVLALCRHDLCTKRGGDTLLVENPIPFLKERGISVTIATERNIDISDCDLVHLYGITRVHETHSHLMHALRHGKPVVLTPMYNSRRDYENYIRNGSSRLIRMLYSMLPYFGAYQLARTFLYSIKNGTFFEAFSQLMSGYERQQKAVLRGATVLTPNSDAEHKTICEELCVPGGPSLIVPSGVEVDSESMNVSQDLFLREYGVQDFVLCAGRIEPLKNQVKLMEALTGTGVPVVFTGSLPKEHAWYAREFMQMVRGSKQFQYLGVVARAMVFSAMKNAHVVAVPSWLENSTLTGLEGGVMDANVVLTERGFGSSYFRDDVWYCDPADVNSIRNAVLSAHSQPRGARSFRDRVLHEYTWQRVSDALRQAYARAMELSRGR